MWLNNGRLTLIEMLSRKIFLSQLNTSIYFSMMIIIINKINIESKSTHRDSQGVKKIS